MSSLNTYSLNLPFWELGTAATLVAVVVLVAILRFQEHGKVYHETKKIYGLKDIPGLKPTFPIIGNFLLLLPIKDLFRTGLKLCEEFGDMIKCYGPNQTIVLLHSAELVQTLLKSGDFGHIAKSHLAYGPLKSFISNGVLVSEGPFWQGQRKILMKSQSFSNLKAYMGMLNKHGKRMVEALRELYKVEQPQPVNFLINRTFLCVISEMITGYDAEDEEEIDKYHQNIQIWKEAVINKIMKPWLLLDFIWMWNPLKKKHDKAVEELFAFVKRKLEKQKLAREKRNLGQYDGNSSCFRSVLDELLDAGVNDNQIVDEVNIMMFGGHETGACAIHFFCLTMALNPECQAKCRQEINELLVDREEMGLTFDDVQGGLKYLERCILETMRLFPPIFMFFRQLKSPLTLEYKGKCIVLPPGTSAAVTPFGLHRKPEYFPEPEIFNPDRFLPEEIAKRSAYVYLPFSAGPRNCLGMKFAMIEMKTIASYLIRNFEITTTDKIEDVELLPYVTITPSRDYTFTFKKLVP